LLASPYSLRGLFLKKGLVFSTGAIAAAISAHAVEAAPAGLAAASVAAASILGLAEEGARLMGWAMAKAGLLAGAAVVMPMVCVTLAVPQLIGKTSEAPALTEVTAFNLFTNAPDRFRAGPYCYSISGKEITPRFCGIASRESNAHWHPRTGRTSRAPCSKLATFITRCCSHDVAGSPRNPQCGDQPVHGKSESITKMT
jgi:hypothetical protein